MHNEERHKSDGISTNELIIVIIKKEKQIADCNGVDRYKSNDSVKLCVTHLRYTR